MHAPDQIIGEYVDYRSSLSFVGTVLKYLALAPASMVVLAAGYGEDPLPFVVTAVVMAVAGAGLELLRTDRELGRREALLLVSLTWFAVPAVGTLPYLVAGQGTVADPVNALFESMSGFTTTGATVLGEISVERHGHAILMWRQLTQWIGGMGIIVLMVAVLPDLSVGGAQVMEEEAPGFSIDKLTPRIQETARALWGIYVGFTIAAAAVYYGLHVIGVAPEMDLYNAVAHALTTLPTGGFSPERHSIEAFSPAIQWAMMPFMLVAGTNFALFWYVFDGSPGRLTGNREFRAYVFAIGVVGALVAVLLYTGEGLVAVPEDVAPLVGSVENALRQGLFQSISIVTTTGYASMAFDTWDQSAQVTLLFAMFLGGSAGSAAGSVKIVRWYVVHRAIGRQLFTTVHPDAVRPIRFARRALDDETVRGIVVFVALFLSIFAVSTVLIFLAALRTATIEDFTALEAASVAIATLGNVGPGFGIAGPMNNFLPFSDAAKLYMVFLMWIGRLEILSVLVVFSPTFWRQ